MNQPVGTIPPPQPTLSAPYALQTNLQTNLRPKLPAQPNLNPNNRPIQYVQIIEGPELETKLRECNNLQLISRHIIEPEGDKNVQVENLLPLEQTPQ